MDHRFLLVLLIFLRSFGELSSEEKECKDGDTGNVFSSIEQIEDFLLGDSKFRNFIERVNQDPDNYVISASVTSFQTSCSEHDVKNDNTDRIIPGNCSSVCNDVMNGKQENRTAGFATAGSPSIVPSLELKKNISIYCDCTNGSEEAWTVFQRRVNGSVDFYRNWANYTEGFGDTSGEFWMGLDAINWFTGQGGYELRVDLMDWDGNKVYAEYRNFSVENATTNFTLPISGYTGSGGAGDSMVDNEDRYKHNNMQFSTRDRDNDNLDGNCAIAREGAWWFNNCMDAHLNGEYFGDNNYTGRGPDGIVWKEWKLSNYSLKAVEMKFRRKQCAGRESHSP